MTDPCEGKYDIVSRLRDHTNRDDNDIAEAAAYIERLRAERDEARRMYCDLVAAHGLAPRYDETGSPEEVTEGKQFARRLRWDCYKDQPVTQPDKLEVTP